MPGGILQEKEPAVRGARRLESGQDTAEYVLIIILLALAFTSGMMVWAKSVQGGYEGGADCIAANTGQGAANSGRAGGGSNGSQRRSGRPSAAMPCRQP